MSAGLDVADACLIEPASFGMASFARDAVPVAVAVAVAVET
jgi:hypothetical protein